MGRKSLNLKSLAALVDATNEHMRELQKGIAFPSKNLLKQICLMLELNYIDCTLRRLVSALPDSGARHQIFHPLGFMPKPSGSIQEFRLSLADDKALQSEVRDQAKGNAGRVENSGYSRGMAFRNRACWKGTDGRGYGPLRIVADSCFCSGEVVLKESVNPDLLRS